ncbi:right-handed parallel beta-helix repeat-containing protein [Pontiella sulfatireligans]|uniref:Right handed beta helix domain-containing protein n=1 Tax=Pontiella sulfatireligans TaxID=2750658 RepID=A0A6C2UQW6_9BACT|nr:right-handed parallel beta-helix repeat-containing protein [Pontiella sulfatireligans]VGO22685.1 hypothetical protein SCARR_04780 [Pontiella sulfatireligans]
MKKVLFTVALLVASSVLASPKTFYIDSAIGQDANDGLSPNAAFQTLGKVNSLKLEAGDTILFTSGQVFKGSLNIQNVSGNAEAPIVISSTGPEKAVIDGKGRLAALSIMSSSFITVKNLEITADGGASKNGANRRSMIRYGIFYDTPESGNFGNLIFQDLYIHDVYYNDNGYVRPNMRLQRKDKQLHGRFGWGVKVDCREGSTLKNVLFKNCVVERVSSPGIRLKSHPNDAESPNMEDVQILDCRLTDIGGPGIVVSAADNTIIRGCKTLRTGSRVDPRGRGQGTGIWVFNNNRAVIEKNTVIGARGPRDSAGIHVDAMSRNVFVQYNLSIDNEGAFVQLLGQVRNSTYRYNVSINDGARRKGEGHAAIDGYIFKLFSYVLADTENPEGPFDSYVYNNTIYVGRDVQDSTFSVESKSRGALFANNIVYTENDIFYNREESETSKLDDAQEDQLIYFRNNMFRKKYDWMSNPFTVPFPVIANPRFANAGGQEISDYIPQNKAACSKGIRIQKLPDDEQGLIGGFDVEYDILGMKVDSSRPLIGAIRPY